MMTKYFEVLFYEEILSLAPMLDFNTSSSGRKLSSETLGHPSSSHVSRRA